MSEIAKLYENVGVLKECLSPCYINKTWRKTHDCPNCDNRENYPPFTAEKQIGLIKLLQRKNGYKFSFSSTNDNSEYLFFAHKDNTPMYELIVAGDKCYEEALAGFINTLWQDLTEEEKQQVKGIM